MEGLRQPRPALLTLALLLLLWRGGAAGQEAPRPRITAPAGADGDELQLRAGADLRLRCEGAARLAWAFPTSDYAPAPQVEAQELGGGRFASTLTLRNASAANTGYYNCSLEARPLLGDAFYVYFADPDTPWVDEGGGGFQYRHTQTGGSVTFDCRTNDRSLSVALIDSANVERTPGETASDGVVVTWLPRLGFVLSHLNVRNQGHYLCRASAGGVANDDELSLHLVVSQPTYFPAPTVLPEDGNPHAVLGADVTLSCTVEAALHATFHMVWITPPGSRAEEEGRLTASNATAPIKIVNGEKKREGNVTLHIRQVKESDAGNYTCVISGTGGTGSNASFDLPVYNSSVSYVEFDLQPPEATHLVVSRGKTAVWVVYITAYPKPNISWYGPNDKLVAEATTAMLDFGVTLEQVGVRHKAMLHVKDADLQRRGDYHLHVVTAAEEKTLNLSLTVLAEPIADLRPPAGVHAEGRALKAECEAQGWPQPEVRWEWRPCPRSLLRDCVAADAPPQPLPPDAKVTEEALSDVMKKSIVTFYPNTSAILLCLASNSEGNSSDAQPLQVTDLPGNDTVVVWGGDGSAEARVVEAVQGDDVDLWCGALKENHTWEEAGGGSPLRWFRNATAMDGAEAQTALSVRSRLTLRALRLVDGGPYECRAADADDGVVTRSLLLNIKKPVKAFVRSTNLNGSAVSVSRGAPLELRCEAWGVPAPALLWLRDGRPVRPPPNSTQMVLLPHALRLNFVTEADEGEWACRAENKGGRDERSLRVSLKEAATSLSAWYIAGISILVVLLIIAIPLAYCYWKVLRLQLKGPVLPNFMEGAPDVLNPDLPADEQAELLPYDRKWEFPRERLKLGKQLGAGAFGVVVKAEAQGIVEGEDATTVAVKMVKRSADFSYLRALASELKILVHLGRHLNVVNLLGACTGNIRRNELLVIVEFCRFGNLHNYLLRHRDGFVDQVDPRTGRVDATIGAERMERARAGSFGQGGRIKYASLSFSGSESGARSDSSDGDAPPAAHGPEDYRAAAALAAAAGGGACVDSAGVESICMSPTGGEEGPLTSNGSAQPHWRSNYGGDYRPGRVGPICTRDLLCWAYQVARGMEYLARRKVLHGDLAARNILLADDNVVKICDFGLAKSMYKSDNYKKKGDGPLPVKWMALESIRDRVFSTQSDVWSFGVVLWELFSLGATPYPGMAADEHLYNKLLNGYRMERPDHAPPDAYEVMLRCWQRSPQRRPPFDELADTLGAALDDSVRNHYLDLNCPYMDMNEQWARDGATDYLGMLGAPDYGNLVSPEPHDNDYINSDLASGPLSPRGPGSPASPLSGGGDASDGYLLMRGSTLAPGSAPLTPDLFSPRAHGAPQVFTFAGPRAPAVSSSSAVATPPASPATVVPGAVHNPGYTPLPQQAPTAGLTSGPDNYVNMPQQKRAPNGHAADKGDAFSNPSYVSGVALPRA